MRALIVYESMFGNTRNVAEAIAEGLADHVATDIVEVGVAPAQPPADVDLLVLGGPTHAMGLTRPKTRADAATKTSEPLVSRGDGVREWLAALPQADQDRAAAAFDTRIDARWMPGSAAHGIAKRLRRHGYRLVAPAQSYYVDDMTGPLKADELERARRWGSRLGHDMAATAPSGS
ncbi:MAG TPA: flavodoxin domain-containing protein [Nocardioidaceae bacterium]|nr:flavodoxin domain-containing protein [Nocardioidaceae bacterium]